MPPLCPHGMHIIACESCMSTELLDLILDAADGDDEEVARELARRAAMAAQGTWPPLPQADDATRCQCCDRPLGDPDCDCKRCPDCKDGWYTGFNCRDLCDTCDGSGWL